MDPAQALELEEIARNSIVNETIARGDSPVQRLYAGAVVLVTGASGFLGKQLIEKLFRSCKVQKIYILLRPKQNKSLNERVKDIIQDQLFEYLHETQSDFVTKLIPVKADITQICLGMTEENWTTLTEEVTFIFHGAATINFVEPLKVATLTNVRGTREMLTLARSCKKLNSFVHISTAFVHATPDRVGQPVLEQFYDCSFDPNFVIDLVQEIDEQKLDAITPQLIANWPNTYTFTKALAEELVRRTAGVLPISIVRPAIVMPAYREPPGWVDKTTMNGPVGFVVGACLGGLHVMYANINTILDMVPVDLANNAALVAANETIERHARGETDIKIYTMTSSRTSIKIDTLHTFLETEARSLVTPNLMWYGFVIMTASKLVFFALTWLLHFIPGYLVDFVLKLSRQKPKVIRLFNKAYKQNQVYGYFMTNFWKFGDSNLLELYRSLSPEDQIIFDCDAETVDVNRYMKICCIGVRKYIFKDGLQNTQYAIRKAFWLRILNVIYLTLYGYVMWKFLLMIYIVLQFFVQPLRT